MGRKILIILLFCLVFSIGVYFGIRSCIFHSIESQEYTKKPTSIVSKITEKDENMLQEMLKSGLVEQINPELNEALVNPVTWTGLKYQDKENLARFLSEYCGKKKGTGLNWVDIKDSYSGKKLAKYSESWGFKIY